MQMPVSIRFLLVWLAAWHGLAIVVSADDSESTIDFVAKIRPILKSKCYGCHSAEKSEAGLRLDSRERAFAGSDSGKVIHKGDSGQSLLIERIRSQDPGERMPPKGKPLSENEIELLVKWIDDGAKWPDGVDPLESYLEHWAYQPINRPALPVVANQAWPRNGIDRFILQKLEGESVTPSRRADRETLVRRLYLDLIGLPPSPEDWQRWTTNGEPNWYEQLVDELIASPHYGERWGRYWLDMARYADSDGYEKDEPRRHAYQWRDWVIRAFNRDLPFDQFTEQQIAGDLLPGATPNVRLATGFHRNTLTNREGGIDKEEDRVKQVVDRTNTIATVWLGLTVECAQCHTHKYDPLTQREYYQLYAFFNSSDESNFPLQATRLQRLEFEKAKRAHAAASDEARKKLAAIRTEVSSRVAELESDWLRRYPSGNAAPDAEQAVVQFSFDTGHELTNQIDGQKADFNGTPPSETTIGRRGLAIELDGKANRLQIRTKTKQQPKHHALTLSAWCFFRGGIGAVLTKMDESADFHGIDFTVNNGMLEVHLVDTWPRDSIKVTTKKRIEKNQWQHVLVRYDGSKKASGVHVFIDGKRQELDVHFDQLAGDFASDQPWRAGSRRTGTFFNGKLDELRVYYRAISDAEVKLLAGDPRLETFLATAKIQESDRSPAQRASQFEFLVSAHEDAGKLQQQLEDLSKNAPKLRHGTGVGLAQRESMRPTHVHLRGEFLRKGEEVSVDTPRFLHPIETRGSTADRLDLARWILSERNTLTPRVTVNRFWQVFFGHGIVKSDRDFGSQGDQPTHPELLDWLSSEFVRNEWSLKRLHRLIVGSATYQQSSAIRPELGDRDPNNTWLARQNRLRVDAEVVRDLALAASGLLDDRVHGPSVFPPLPPGIVELAFVDVINRGPWKVSQGGDRYRRGLYTFFQRTSAYPMLSLFDAPDSNTTCTRRERSNTPLQALTLWNDPIFVECAVAMARRAIEYSADQDANDGFVKATSAQLYLLGVSRTATPDDLRDLQALYEASLKIYRNDPELTKGLVGATAAKSAKSAKPSSDESESSITLPKNCDRAQFAAWIAVARTVLNLDAVVNRQ